MKLELWFPCKPLKINQVFGINPDVYKPLGLNGHNGIDFGAYHGQPVRAAHEGIVVYAGMDSKEGIGVVIRTIKPFDYNGETAYFKTIYWHLINNVPVKVGQVVKFGDIIGYADNTGFSTGDHLHFGLKPQAKGENDWTWWNIEQNNGYAGSIDPIPYFNGFCAEDGRSWFAQLAEISKKVAQLLLLFKK